MKITKQPSGMDFQQPLLNKVLRIHVAVMSSSRKSDDGSRQDNVARSVHDAKTRKLLPYNNWRCRILRKFWS